MKRIIAIAALMALTGCSALKSTEPPQTIYLLRAAEAQSPSSEKLARVMEITTPSVPPGMDGDRIVLYTEGGRKLDYYAGARWPEPLDMLVQDFTRRSIANNLPYIVAVTPGQSVDADYRLHVKINEFQPIYEGDITSSPTLKVNVEFILMRLPEEMIVRSFSLSKSGVASSARLDVITAGLEKMLQEIEAEAATRIDEAINTRPKT